MSDETVILLAEDLLDFLNMMEAAIAKLKMQIDKNFGPREDQERKWSWDPAKIAWQKAEGASGEYERSEDMDNPEFKAMLKDLAAHQDRLTRNGMFYWVFRNGSMVGRKPSRFAKAKPAENKA
jgi:hypothetical protein